MQAKELGHGQPAIRVLTGALRAVTQMLPIEVVDHALVANLPERQRHMLDARRRAAGRGASLADAVPT